MRRISFNPRFVNEAGNDLVPGKIHTIRQSYDFWKRFEGKDAALFAWEGQPYRSKQRVFCVKRIVSVQKIKKSKPYGGCCFSLDSWPCPDLYCLYPNLVSKNDGFKSVEEFEDWFYDYPDGDMAVLHFTDFRYE
jgi:hypothetical protein